MIREMMTESDTKTLKMADVRECCSSKGYKPDQVDDTIEEYEELNIWQVNQARTKLTLV